MWQELEKSVPDVSTLRRILFSVANLPKDIPDYWQIVSNFSCESSTSIKPENIRVLVENLQFIDSKAFVTDEDLMHELCEKQWYQLVKKPLGIVLISKKNTCSVCGGKLLVRSDRPSLLTVYTEQMGTVPATHFRKYCQNNRKGCSFTQHYGYYTVSDDSVLHIDDNWYELPFFLSTAMTAFETSFLDHFEAELLLGQITYKQKSEIYNYMHKYEQKKKACSTVPFPTTDDNSPSINHQDLIERACLDSRRLTEGHLKYCLLKVFQKYKETFRDSKMYTNLEQTLDEVTPLYYKAFTKLYKSHQCSYPGCNKVFVLDGNCKNRRDVCGATEAGFIECTGLEGVLKTGCQFSPMKTTKYCVYHTPRISPMSNLPDPDTIKEESKIPASDKQDGILRMITSKKTTRTKTYYQVAWLNQEEVTWELESSLPTKLIEEFEESLKPTEAVISGSEFGVLNHTVVVHNETQPDSEPPTKKSRSYQDLKEGVFATDKDEIDLTCDTLKDKVRIHNRTAGILAGMWPCGVMVMLSELFCSESKSQVYAALHELLINWKRIRASLKFVCYDDACHLRRYACNPRRSGQNECTKFLSGIEIVVDKMHMAGHVDQWCKEHCNPRSFQELNVVDTEICEQHFSWLSRYSRMTRHMNRNHFMFLILYLCDLHNQREERKLAKAGFM